MPYCASCSSYHVPEHPLTNLCDNCVEDADCVERDEDLFHYDSEPLEEWTDEDEEALEDWEERRRQRIAEDNEY